MFTNHGGKNNTNLIFSRTNTPAMGIKRKKIRIVKKKIPFYQPIRRQHSYIRWNYTKNNLTYYKFISLGIPYRLRRIPCWRENPFFK
jgi:hypothetical protein